MTVESEFNKNYQAQLSSRSKETQWLSFMGLRSSFEIENLSIFEPEI